ncbi:hypothetical protein AF331_02790 [Rossellomorea marisflavi]|uniref:Uncharacterized protein n=1 Tax=Rossellomorea marisflavi TaxID=189381 RepID=A0A0M0GNR1_9BACI|nr:hypothetical protein AF331_02790 [Rossellomorea marisflavi]
MLMMQESGIHRLQDTAILSACEPTFRASLIKNVFQRYWKMSVPAYRAKQGGTTGADPFVLFLDEGSVFLFLYTQEGNE